MRINGQSVLYSEALGLRTSCSRILPFLSADPKFADAGEVVRCIDDEAGLVSEAIFR